MSSAVVKNVTLSGTLYITGNDNVESTSYDYVENPITQGQGGFHVLKREFIATENPFMPTGFIVSLVQRTASKTINSSQLILLLWNPCYIRKN
jgi:hypothetical protein